MRADRIEVCPDPTLEREITACEYGCAPGLLPQYCGDRPCDLSTTSELCYDPPEPARCGQEGLACTAEGTTDDCNVVTDCG